MNDRLDERLQSAKPSAGHRDYSEKQTANRKQAARKWWKKHAAETLARKRTPAARALLPALSWQEATEAGLSISRHKHASLYWMDTDGRLHREEELSAEELIRRWKEAHEEQTE